MDDLMSLEVLETEVTRHNTRIVSFDSMTLVTPAAEIMALRNAIRDASPLPSQQTPDRAPAEVALDGNSCGEDSADLGSAVFSLTRLAASADQSGPCFKDDVARTGSAHDCPVGVGPAPSPVPPARPRFANSPARRGSSSDDTIRIVRTPKTTTDPWIAIYVGVGAVAFTVAALVTIACGNP